MGPSTKIAWEKTQKFEKCDCLIPRYKSFPLFILVYIWSYKIYNTIQKHHFSLYSPEPRLGSCFVLRCVNPFGLFNAELNSKQFSLVWE